MAWMGHCSKRQVRNNTVEKCQWMWENAISFKLIFLVFRVVSVIMRTGKSVHSQHTLKSWCHVWISNDDLRKMVFILNMIASLLAMSSPANFEDIMKNMEWHIFFMVENKPNSYHTFYLLTRATAHNFGENRDKQIKGKVRGKMIYWYILR